MADQNYYDSLKKLMQGAGLQPGSRGSGFADIDYWNDVGPSQFDRLKSDLAGTGPDQSTGTPGSGAWQGSGRGGASQAPINQAPTMPAMPLSPPTQPPLNQAPIAGKQPLTDPWAGLMKLLQGALSPAPSGPTLGSNPSPDMQKYLDWLKNGQQGPDPSAGWARTQ